MISDRDMARLNLPAGSSLRSILGWPYVIAAVLTVAIGLMAWLGALAAGLSAAWVIMLTQFAVTAWIVLAAGPLSGSANGAASALLRASVLADASVVTLVVLGIWSGGLLTFLEGLRIYVLWAVVAFAAGVLSRLGNSSGGRAAWGVAASILLAAASSTLFWSAGLLAVLAGPTQSALAKALVAVNPLAAVAAIMGPQLAFSWVAQPVMYGITRMGQDFPPPAVSWWATIHFWLTIAAIAGLWLALRRVWRRFYYGS